MKQSIATTDVATATHSRDVEATTRTISRKVVETVAAFDICSHLVDERDTATPPTPAASRAASTDPRDMMGNHRPEDLPHPANRDP